MTDARAAVDAGQVAVARDILATAERVVILTGAGLSADSGLRTFRGPGGLWRDYRPEQLASPEAFERDPCLVWGWYDARRRAVAAATPNAAHRAMARCPLRRDGVSIVTQNVDGLHTTAAREAAAEIGAAGTDDGSPGVDGPVDENNPAVPLELHGSLFRTRCTGCGNRERNREPIDAETPASLPRCGACGALLRPDVVWFGESLGAGIERAFALAGAARACLVVGTSAMVQPAASVALVTVRAGGRLVEVNPEETPLTPACAVSVRAPAAAVVPALLEP